MRMKKLIALAIASVMVLTAAGCGAKTESAPGTVDTKQEEQNSSEEQDKTEEAAAQDGGEITVDDLLGIYSDETRGDFYLGIDGTDNPDEVFIFIGCQEGTIGSSWEMYGKLNGNVISYEKAVKTTLDQGDANQETVKTEEVYSDGTGTIEILKDSATGDISFIWKDDKEDAGKGILFVWDNEMNSLMQESDDIAGAYLDGEENPTLNWAGYYADSNHKERMMLIESGSEGTNTCTVTVTDTPSPEQMVKWTATGEFDEETMTIRYTDCIKTEYQLDANGKPASENTVYNNGTGSFVIDQEEQTITWTDDMEDAGNGSVFAFSYFTGEGAGEFGTDEPTEEAP